MSDNSRIEWTDATWNPTTGCTKVSPGCDHCYAEGIFNRFNGPGAFDTVKLRPERLEQPLRWRKPRRVFVNSMSDLFHDDVPDEFIARCFAVMAWAQRHTFQLLTKRHGRMRALLNSAAFLDLCEREWCNVQDWTDARLVDPDYIDTMPRAGYWPLPNVWVGVSVEDQRWADIRIPALIDTPAAVRFLSCEPLLGPVNLHRLYRVGSNPDRNVFPLGHVAAGIHWVIVGAESGRGARPMDVQWARDIKGQCVDAGVPFFLKQYAVGGRKVHLPELDGRNWVEFPAAAVPA